MVIPEKRIELSRVHLKTVVVKIGEKTPFSELTTLKLKLTKVYATGYIPLCLVYNHFCCSI